MTLLMIEGFDMGDSAVRAEWSSGSGLAFPAGPLGGLAASYPGGGGLIRRMFTPSAHVFAGVRMVNGNSLWLYGDSNTTVHLTVVFQNDGSVTLRRGDFNGTIIASTPPGTYVLGYIYVELEATISDTVGIANVRINGATTNTLSFTGDTKNGGTSTNFDAIGLYSAGGGSPFDDVYVCNDQGSLNNTFLGEARVITLAPNGNGTSSQFVGSDADSVNNYLLVDDLPYATSDYVGSPTVGNRDSYTVADLPAGTWSVKGVQVAAVTQKSDAGAASIKTVLRSGGTNYYGPTKVLGTAWQTIMDLRETDPATSVAWTAAGVNAAEIGVEVA